MARPGKLHLADTVTVVISHSRCAGSIDAPGSNPREGTEDPLGGRIGPVTQRSNGVWCYDSARDKLVNDEPLGELFTRDEASFTTAAFAVARSFNAGGKPSRCLTFKRVAEWQQSLFVRKLMLRHRLGRKWNMDQ